MNPFFNQRKKRFRFQSHLLESCKDYNLSIRMVNSFSDFLGAMRLLYNEYSAKGLIEKNDSHLYFSPYLLLPRNILFNAVKDNKIIGTIALIEDSPIGLPIENVHSDEVLLQRIAQKARIAEIGSFAIDSKFKNKGITILLYKAIFVYLQAYKKIDSVLISVHPRTSNFYLSMFQFKQIGEEKKYASLNGARSIPLVMNVKETVEILDNNKLFDTDTNIIEVKNLLKNNINKESANNAKEKDISYLQIWEEFHIKKYFQRCGINDKSLTPKQKEIIYWLYPSLKSNINKESNNVI